MRAVTMLVLALAICACSSGVPFDPGALESLLPPLGSEEPTDYFEPEDTPYSGPAPGSWTGTITLHGVIDYDKTEDGSSGDPGSTYYQTYTTTEEVTADVTDTFTITASDPEDIEYGIHAVELEGSAANTGSTLERYVTTWEKQNSGCTWTEEVGSEVTGSWSDAGEAVGSISFSEDGEYEIDIRADVSGPDGSYETPELPYRIWTDISNVSGGCEGPGNSEVTDTQGPIIWWGTDLLSGTDESGMYVRIFGQLDRANPGSVVEGSSNWQLTSPEGAELTITWNLVHDGPITLPRT